MFYNFIYFIKIKDGSLTFNFIFKIINFSQNQVFKNNNQKNVFNNVSAVDYLPSEPKNPTKVSFHPKKMVQSLVENTSENDSYDIEQQQPFEEQLVNFLKLTTK